MITDREHLSSEEKEIVSRLKVVLEDTLNQCQVSMAAAVKRYKLDLLVFCHKTFGPTSYRPLEIRFSPPDSYFKLRSGSGENLLERDAELSFGINSFFDFRSGYPAFVVKFSVSGEIERNAFRKLFFRRCSELKPQLECTNLDFFTPGNFDSINFLERESPFRKLRAYLNEKDLAGELYLTQDLAKVNSKTECSLLLWSLFEETFSMSNW